jgi:dTMP kinase
MKHGNEYDGVLIAIEGLDGSGKSTVVSGIETWADDNNVDLQTTAEPYLDCLTDYAEDASGYQESYVFQKDREAHIENVIEPALRAGQIVVTDRYHGSTIAYQRRDETPHNYIAPDLTIYLDVSVDTAVERSSDDSKFEYRDRLETAKERYDDLYENCDSGVRIINAEQDISVVRHLAINAVQTKWVTNTDDGADELQTYADAVAE